MKKLFLILFILLFAFKFIAQEKSTLKDSRDGKIYKTVKIGTQIWMAENLSFKTNKACWYYNNDKLNVPKYGYLYSWEAAKSACPGGWHLPDKEEFETLIKNSGSTIDDAYIALLPGGSSGLSALFGGFLDDNGEFISLEEQAVFWSSTSESDDYAWSLYCDGNNSEILIGTGKYSNGFSVRCIKNN